MARTEKGENLLGSMRRSLGSVHLEDMPLDEAMAMHAHMVDFKKRGAFIRMGWRRATGKPVPDYGYRPAHIPLKRKLVEAAIFSIFIIGGTKPARRLVELVPIAILGPMFSFLRRSWKRLSKPTKRSGLHTFEVDTWSTPK